MELRCWALCVISQLCLINSALGKRALGRGFEEEFSRAGDLSVEDDEEAPSLRQEFINNSFSEIDSDIEEDSDIDESRKPDWQSKTCNPFKRFASKSYYFDLKSGNSFVAIELKRTRVPQGLFLNIHMNTVWRIKESRGKVEFEPALAPGAKKSSNLSVNLLNDDVEIKSYEIGKQGKTQSAIEFKITSSGKKFAFAGGSYYPRVRVKKALELARNLTNKKENKKEIYANAGNTDLYITPALGSAKALGATIAFNTALFFPSLAVFHETAFAIAPMSDTFGLVLGAQLLFAGAVGIVTYKRQAKAKRDSELTASEKIHEVIWCLSTTTDKCSIISRSRNCFLVCDTPQKPNDKGGKVFVRPLIAQKKNFQCS